MADSSPHLYIAQGLAQGHAAEVVSRASIVRSRSLAHGVPPILSLRHLAQLTGVSYDYLREIVGRVRDPYLDIDRRKRDGGIREISSPEPVLMDVQRWLLHNVFSSVPMHPASFAYQRDRSIVQCAEQHVGAHWLVKLDLHDFFGSIQEKRIFDLLLRLGYSKLVSLEIARICTRLRGPRDEGYQNFWAYNAIPSYVVGSQGVLPQGAPTSGALANTVASNLDAKLHDLAASRGLGYTRYSDDLTFSAGPDYDRKQATALIAQVRNIVRDQHFVLHEKKTHVVPPGARTVVLGLLVDSQGVRLLPEYKRRLQVHVRGVGKFGLVEHASHRGFESVLSFVNHVDGLIAFAAGVEREYAQHARGAWNDALARSGYPLEV